MQTHCTSKPIYAGSKVIGYVKGDTFYKTISSSIHFLRRPPAIMFNVQSLKDAKREGAKYAHVTDRETGDIYTALISLIWEKPVYKDYGYGEQVGLCLKDWAVTHTEAPTSTNPSYSGAPQVTATNETEPPKYSEVQLSLFDEQVTK